MSPAIPLAKPKVETTLETLRAVVGRDALLTHPDEMLVYECDGLPQHRAPPLAVVFPRSTEEVAEVLRVLARDGVPFSPRGAGTGLSGGALAFGPGIVIELARMRRLLEIAPDNRLARVETGLVNAQLSKAVAGFGLHYAPDPSSQATCTIGGNIAENAGGIHCLKYGTTVDHVLAARVVLAGGEVVDLPGPGAPGYDLLGVFIGSEGTFGIATEATLRLVPLAPAVRTLLAIFTDVDDASRAVSEIIAAGLVPAALEMMDGAIIRAVEASVFAAGIPLDAEAALIVELDGLEAGLDEEASRAESICRRHGARSVRHAADERERKKLWAARKGAFGAMGRISPDTMLQDAVVPRSRLPQVLAATYRIGAKYGLRVANVFHAGDGNLHPFICFDARFPDQVSRVKEASREVMETCVSAGGSITGEHGVGFDKSAYLPLIFSEDDMDAMLRVRAAFDPTGLCNPGKIIPTSRSCGEGRAVLRQPVENESRGGGEDRETVTEKFPAAGHKLTTNSPPPPQTTHPAFNSDKAHHLLTQIVGAEHVCVSPHPLVYASTCLEVSPSSADEACEVLRMARLEGWAVIPAGAGTWLDVGNPVRRADLIVRTSRIERMLEHEPADLVASAEAGITLSALNAELRRSGGQWLPLDPPDDGRATIGGVAATGLGGAQGLGYGVPRSSIIGMKVALADGRMIKAGGRVVKNVAGYDLCKLFVGSYGTLGLITELTFKLRPVPAHEVTVIACGLLHASLLKGAHTLMAGQFLPVGIELLSPRMAATIGAPVGEKDFALLIRFAGNERAVRDQAARACALLATVEQLKEVNTYERDESFWRGLASAPLGQPEQLTWRAHMQTTALGSFLDAAYKIGGEAFSSESLWHAGVADGRLRVTMRHAVEASGYIASLQILRDCVQKSGGALVCENAPGEIKSRFDAWGEPGGRVQLMRRIKQQLDPHESFSPGRFVAGI
jgi:D-lactate dehydrogenase (cytochrome)